jgi:hypothetical protein
MTTEYATHNERVTEYRTLSEEGVGACLIASSNGDPHRRPAPSCPDVALWDEWM